MNDQQQHWDELHSQGAMKDYAKMQTEFAEEAIKYFPQQAKVLELGCGLGNDAVFFSQRGYTVVATDFSETAIEQNKRHYDTQQNLSFQVVDMSKPLPFTESEFDVVYARLSLHYFTDRETKALFNEIFRILKQGGLFSFICKSVDDPLYGQGEQLEKDMFQFKGHIRHFFTVEYAKECLDNKYNIKVLEARKEDFYGKQSASIKVIAEKQ